MRASMTYKDFCIDVLFEVGVERERVERTLLEAGIALPLQHRMAWTCAHPESESWFAVVRDRSGAAHAAFAVEVASSRALPGYRILRVEHFGAAATAGAREAALFAVGELARRCPRVLRAYVEVFSPVAAVRAGIARVAPPLGFKPSLHGRCYRNTLLVNLLPPESEVYAALPKKTRRDIRAAARYPVEVRPITELKYRERLANLLRETMSRTGGVYDEPTWEALILLANRLPNCSRLVGLFRTDTCEPDALLAFAWGRHHGDHADYATAASTRRTELRLPLGYPLVWDLICWAKRNGAEYLDLGGVSEGSLTDGDPLGGISDFKRYFSRTQVTVGAEWIMEPRWLPSVTANAISSTAALLSRYHNSLSRSLTSYRTAMRGSVK